MTSVVVAMANRREPVGCSCCRRRCCSRRRQLHVALARELNQSRAGPVGSGSFGRRRLDRSCSRKPVLGLCRAELEREKRLRKGSLCASLTFLNAASCPPRTAIANRCSPQITTTTATTITTAATTTTPTVTSRRICQFDNLPSHHLKFNLIN